MKILAIETSCDETAISIIEAKGGFRKPQFKIISDTVISQVNLHKEYGGVYPSLAKREHTRNLLPILKRTLNKSGLLLHHKKNKKLKAYSLQLTERNTKKVKKIMEREPELAGALLDFVGKNKVPKIDAVAVTQGPGLEPALWTGINFAKALALLWNKPFIPVNHLEGHIFASLINYKLKIINYKFPILALLISGGHTQLVLMKSFDKFKIIGETRDDAVGEAYDKVARTLGLPYPGGPQISALAEICADSRRTNAEKRRKRIFAKGKNSSYLLPTTNYQLPRPMINSGDFDFSFSGLKTAVLYKVQKLPKLTLKQKKEIAFEFEEAVTEVLFKKTVSALEKYKAKTLILGGGVVANKNIRKTFSDYEKNTDGLDVLIPEIKYTGDNAVMIGIAGYFRYLNKKIIEPTKIGKVKANGNLRLR